MPSAGKDAAAKLGSDCSAAVMVWFDAGASEGEEAEMSARLRFPFRPPMPFVHLWQLSLKDA